LQAQLQLCMHLQENICIQRQQDARQLSPGGSVSA